MPSPDANLAERSGGLVESHKGYDPRLVFFYFVLAALLVTLLSGLAYQQLSRYTTHSEREWEQNTRRVLTPGPRGNIYDRNGVPLVINRPRWTVVIHLDELRPELRAEYARIKKNYLASFGDKKAIPTTNQLAQITRVSVAQHYLDQVNLILNRNYQVDRTALEKHFQQDLLLPFKLVDGLGQGDDDNGDDDFARLIENLPVNSPMEVYAVPTRYYPNKSAAAHVLGYVRADKEIDGENLPGDELRTFKAKNPSGQIGLEKFFNEKLEGEPGGSIYRVDPAGYRINPPLDQRKPRKGTDLVTSLDLDLQIAAEQALCPPDQDPMIGAAVALDIASGEVLALVSKPDYDLNAWYPRMPKATYTAIQEQGAEFNQALNGVYSPGSTFKILVAIAGMRSGRLDPLDTHVDCEGAMMIGRQLKTCDNGHAHHGNLDLVGAIAKSCDIYFYTHGIDIGIDAIAAEARRFHLDRPTGIELPYENDRMIIPDPTWLKKTRNEAWTPGHTANVAIGQGDVDVTPLQMACFVASVARGEVFTQPTLVHDPSRPPQHTEPIGLTPEQRTALLNGMKGVLTMPGGTATEYLNIPSERIPGVAIAGKTGTAQRAITKDGKFLGNANTAWFICFAPADKPEIAVATAVRSDVPGEAFGGGRYAAPVATALLRKYFEKKNNGGRALIATPAKK